ncbi:MAG: putative Na+/H+ antiporter [Alcaligenaceae bacterium]|nr:putative Na+/H+ antiporter [Alcaligenaceae bacterium]
MGFLATHIEVIATILFACAILHTFSVPFFAKLAHRNGPHSGLWHFFAEVEAVFGIWATLLMLFMALGEGLHWTHPEVAASPVEYLESRNFTEPLFVFTIMIVAASRPILELVSKTVRTLAHVLPIQTEVATFFLTLFAVPLAGSFITEPAAMTLAALMLREAFFARSGRTNFKYLTLGVLFVNVSIGGVLTAYAAPPVLMVASKFGLSTADMFVNFGWKSIIAVFTNALIATLICRKDILSHEVGTGKGINAPDGSEIDEKMKVPLSVMLIHIGFLVGVVAFSHHVHVFMGLLMLFMGYTKAYARYQNRLMIKEGLMVGFFLAGLIVLGGLQQWWLQQVLSDLSPLALFGGSVGLTAITDNAALTYLGSLVEGTSELWRYMLVAGAVTGGGLTVIANAPNPAGFSILRDSFPDGAISAKYLFLSALYPTAVATIMFVVPKVFLGL